MTEVGQKSPFDPNAGKPESNISRLGKAMGHAFKTVKDTLSNCMQRTDKTAQTEIAKGPTPKMGGPTLNVQLAKMQQFYDSKTPVKETKSEDVSETAPKERSQRLAPTIGDHRPTQENFDIDDTIIKGSDHKVTDEVDVGSIEGEVDFDTDIEDQNIQKGLDSLYTLQDFDDGSTTSDHK